jgi:2-keto-3-deoxy-L-rhamnonate aldolase RhmA
MKGCTGELQRRVKKGDTLIFGAVMDCRSGSAIEAYLEAGYDAIIVDREHTALNSETILEHIRLSRALGIPCTVRVAEDCYHELCRTLDQGPDGVFVPRIRSRRQVEEIVRMVKYPPLGVRGFGGSTCPAGRYMGWPRPQDQIDYGNRDVMLGIQIETAEALEDLDGILSVSGVDVAVVGNDDLSLGMGIVGQVDSPRYIEAVTRMIDACRRHGVLPGIAGGDPQRIRFWIERGMRVIWYAADVCLMWQGAADQLHRLQRALGTAGSAQAGPQGGATI